MNRLDIVLNNLREIMGEDIQQKSHEKQQKKYHKINVMLCEEFRKYTIAHDISCDVLIEYYNSWTLKDVPDYPAYCLYGTVFLLRVMYYGKESISKWEREQWGL